MESEQMRTEMQDDDLYTFVNNDRIIPIDIKFKNLSYFIKTGMFAKKQLLNDINGHFNTGELTGILGSSGSGKTTLLNILAGYVTKDVKGTIKINGNVRNSNFRRLTAYIMQDDLLQPHLTVEEEMMIVAKLKLDQNMNLQQKQLVVEKIISLFGLNNCYHTRVENISGGERKRLSIALELIRDPPLIFIDEPTSGLDSVTLKLVMDVLVELTNKKRTVICTLNQPPVSVLNNFQQLYFIARGECIYNGTTTNILPFLSSLNLECPLTYSYSEFIIETVELNPAVIPIFVEAVDNSHFEEWGKLDQNPEGVDELIEVDLEPKVSFWLQFWVLFSRMLLQQSRNKVALYVQLFTHLIVGSLFCIVFYDIGNNAKFVYSNYYLCWLVLGFFFYTNVMILAIIFPFELEIMKREYLNRWYSLNPYFLALSIRTIPIMVILGFGFLLSIYFITGQPIDAIRFIKFIATCFILGNLSEGLGLIVGSTFSSLTASVIAPGLISPPTLLAVYGMGYFTKISTFMKALCATSFLRQAQVSLMLALFDSNRPPFDCFDDVECQFKYPKHFLKDLAMLDDSFFIQTIILIGFLTAFRLLAYFAMRYRLNSEEPFNNASYLSQVLLKQ